MSLRRNRVDKRDLQGNVLCGYGNSFRYGLYMFVHVAKPRAGRVWLRELCPAVTSAESWKRGQQPLETLNVAFTCEGLRALGVPDPILETFPEEFRDGMASRSKLLGDENESDPQYWDEGLRAPHVLVMVMAQDLNLSRLREALLARRVREADGLTVTHVERAALLDSPDGRGPYRREHFGFADGFSQPAIRGNAGPNRKKGMGTPHRWWWRSLAPGEFVLGYRGEDGELPAAPVGPFGRSGSYAVVRRLRQHVGRFRRYLREKAVSGLPFLPPSPLPAHPEEREREIAARECLVAAKIVGRWQDGRSLVVSGGPAPIGDELDPRVINSFRYRHDPLGYACPLGAHVRRANPRDGLGWEGKLTKRHRIIRRGMPYVRKARDRGTADDAGRVALPNGVRGDDRGLMFVCYQASIARQFEIVQALWLNDGDTFWLGGERDFLSMGPPGAGAERTAEEQGAAGWVVAGGGGEGAGEDADGAKMTVPGPRPSFLAPQRSFVTTSGGGYFFAPGMTALRALAWGYWL